jgi:hypothetical protein
MIEVAIRDANFLQPSSLRCRPSFQYKLGLILPEFVNQWLSCPIKKKPSFQQSCFKNSFVCWILLLLLEAFGSLGRIPATTTFRRGCLSLNLEPHDITLCAISYG